MSEMPRQRHITGLEAARLTRKGLQGGGRRKLEINPLDRSLPHLCHVSQCGAKTRAGTACQSPPVPGRKRCRLHGGLSPGAPRGSQNGNYTDGEWTAEAIEERRWLRSLVRDFAKTEAGR
jgi:hypothetical protein